MKDRKTSRYTTPKPPENTHRRLYGNTHPDTRTNDILTCCWCIELMIYHYATPTFNPIVHRCFVCVLLVMLAGFIVIFLDSQELTLIVIIAVLAISVGYAIGNIHDDEDEEEDGDGDEWLHPS